MTTYRFLRPLLLSLATPLLFCSTAPAWTYDLTDGNASVTIHADSDYGMNNWTVDNVPQLYRQWFWYRNGSAGGEKTINHLDLVSAEQTSANALTTLYQKSGKFSIEVSYSLTGGAVGSGYSQVGEKIKITNLSDNALDFHFFQFSDFDLGGAGLGDTVQLGQDASGLFNSAYQYKGNSFFADESVSPGAQHAEASQLRTPNSVFARLNDGSPTTLNGNTGPVSGDASWAFQWDPTIAVGGTFSIELTKTVSITSVPEPTALALVPVAVALLGMARRRRSA